MIKEEAQKKMGKKVEKCLEMHFLTMFWNKNIFEKQKDHNISNSYLNI